MEFIKKKRESEARVKDKRIRINVAGTSFETFSSTLERITGTRLALLSVLGETDDAWDQERNEFFFDRHPGVFASILHYYRTEELHTDQNLCGNIIQGVGKSRQWVEGDYEMAKDAQAANHFPFSPD